jgi:hypothetical protein
MATGGSGAPNKSGVNRLKLSRKQTKIYNAGKKKRKSTKRRKK